MSNRHTSTFKSKITVIAAVILLVLIELIDNYKRKLIWGQTWTEALIVAPIIAIIFLTIAYLLLKKRK
jgi:hypothetical protein